MPYTGLVNIERDADKEREIATLKAVVGLRIRALRQERGLSQEALADLAEIHRTYLGDIERGKRNPALENLYAIAVALGVSVRELFPPENPGEGSTPHPDATSSP